MSPRNEKEGTRDNAMKANGKLTRSKVKDTTAARKVKSIKDCVGKCKLKCSIIISNEDRNNIRKACWAMGRLKQQQFYAQTTLNDTRKKRIEYNLVVSGTGYRVCKEFYLTTLDVTQQRINTYHKNKDPEMSTPTLYKTGNNKKTSDKLPNGVRGHINSFPRVESLLQIRFCCRIS